MENVIYDNRRDINKILKVVDKPPQYTKPTLSISISPSTIEHNKSTNVTISANFNKNDGGPVKSYTIKKGNEIIFSNSIITNYTESINVSHGTTTTYTGIVEYDNGVIKTSTMGVEYPAGQIKAGSISANNSVKAYALSYYGVISGSTITNVSALSSRLSTSKSFTTTFTLKNQRVVYMYPKSFGTLTSIKDANNFDYINSYTLSSMNYNNVDYYVYILTDPVTITDFKQIFN